MKIVSEEISHEGRSISGIFKQPKGFARELTRHFRDRLLKATQHLETI
jgi:hypothetical protein